MAILFIKRQVCKLHTKSGGRCNKTNNVKETQKENRNSKCVHREQELSQSDEDLQSGSF